MYHEGQASRPPVLAMSAPSVRVPTFLRRSRLRRPYRDRLAGGLVGPRTDPETYRWSPIEPIRNFMATIGPSRIPRVGLWLDGTAAVWCSFVLLAHIAAAAISCSGDTSSCATTRHKTTVFQGHLTYDNTPFEIVATGVGMVGGFRTDAHGRYCIVWNARRGRGRRSRPGRGRVCFGPPASRPSAGRLPVRRQERAVGTGR